MPDTGEEPRRFFGGSDAWGTGVRCCAVRAGRFHQDESDTGGGSQIGGEAEDPIRGQGDAQNVDQCVHDGWKVPQVAETILLVEGFP